MVRLNKGNIVISIQLFLGIFIPLVIIVLLTMFGTEIRIYPYFTSFILGLICICIPISYTFLYYAIRSLLIAKNENKEFNESRTTFSFFIMTTLGITLLFIAIFNGIEAFYFQRNTMISDITINIFQAALIIWCGGLLLNLLILYNNIVVIINVYLNKREINLRNQPISNIKLMINKGIIHTVFLIGVVCTGGISVLFEESTCFSGVREFSEPSYSLPLTHYHENITNPSYVNQTLLESLETALWSMTKLQTMGGFPLGSLLDGSIMWSDTQIGCPLFEGEFSLQGGTALIASKYLMMYQVEPNPVYLKVASDAAEALLKIQDEENGGFCQEGRIRLDGTPYQPHPRNMRRSTMFDDNAMQSCMDFLLDIYNVTNEEKYLLGINRGFECIMNAEIIGGGWPQKTNYPMDAYQNDVTLNDNALLDIIMLLLKSYNMFPSKIELIQAAERAGQFLIRVQGNGGSSTQTGWAQQYDKDQPSWARAFEPYAICSSQTARAIDMLMELYLYTENETYLEPIPAAITWLENSNISTNLWARLYELETNTPIYGIADGGPNEEVPYVYTLAEARPGYSWEGSYGIQNSIDNYEKLIELNNNTQDYIDWRNTLATDEYWEGKAQEAYKSLDDSGFWVTIEDGNDVIRDNTFASFSYNMIKYLESALD